jgi:hypothetical protein
MDLTSLPQRQSRAEGASRSTAIASSSSNAPTALQPDEGHYSTLAQMLTEVSQDHAHLRTFIYEFARIKLRKELYPRFVEGAWTEIEEQMRGLEAAIDRIEADFANDAPALPFASQLRLADLSGDHHAPESAASGFGMGGTTRFGAGAIQARPQLGGSPAYAAVSLPTLSDEGDRFRVAHAGKHRRSRFWWSVQLSVAAAIGVVIFAATDARFILNKAGLHWLDQPAHNATTAGDAGDRAVAAAGGVSPPSFNEQRPRRLGDVPIPTEYGAYAVVGQRLIEMEQLAMKVPDPRVAISAAFSNPSRAHLPTSPREFIIFRRDLMNSAPDRATVRIVAQVVRALSFDASGHAKSSSVEQSWVIRNNSYPMRVGPFADNPEMIAVRPESPDFVLPAGRYALVLKGISYDFTIDGPSIDRAHCLERTEALNVPIYSECPKT